MRSLGVAACDSEHMTEVVDDAAFVPAGHGRRIAAALLDGVLFSVIVAAAGAAVWRLGLQGMYTSADAGSLEELGLILVAWMSSWTGQLAVNGLMYGVVIWAVLTIWLVRRPGARNGQTIGKQVFGLRATRVDRNPIGVGRSLVREILLKGFLITYGSALIDWQLLDLDHPRLAIVLALALLYGPALADARRRGLHDRACATRVLDARSCTGGGLPSL